MAKMTTRDLSISGTSYVNYAAVDAKAVATAVAAVQQQAPQTVQAGPVVGNNLVYSSVLRNLPTIFSTTQFDQNNSRLNKITEAARNVLIKPAIEAQPYRFGVLEQVRPEIQEYKKAYRGVAGLFTTLESSFDKAEAKYILAEFNRIGKVKSYEEVRKEAEDAAKAEAAADSTKPQPGTSAFNHKVSETEIPMLYSAFYDIGKFLVSMIAHMESRYTRIEATLEKRLRERIQKETQLEKLHYRIMAETDRLAGLEGRRVEILGDYGVAQRLVEEDWSQVYRQQLKRTRILTEGLRGLYYVRVRQTPVSMALADPLALRHGKASDLVPGWDGLQDVDIPDELDDFFDALLEVPVSDWVALKDLVAQLPVDGRIDQIAQLRTARLQTKPLLSYQAKSATFPRPVQSRLATVKTQTRAVVDTLARNSMPLFKGSVKTFQQEAARVLSLADVLAGTRGSLCKEAQTLRDRLEQCVAGMLAQLVELPPSLRLQWAQLAEDDRLTVTDVSRWPGLERAEADDFNVTRTLAELVAWWFRQLDANASAGGLGAMRNMLRAILIHAALGDPNEIVQGEVQVPPRRLEVGAALRLQLNRAPKPGTVLQLLDPQQKLVALLNVDDHDARGTVANITRVELAQVTISAGYRVVASKLTQQLKR